VSVLVLVGQGGSLTPFEALATVRGVRKFASDYLASLTTSFAYD
jgi:hypothetical protein